jgi:hypothetical protein
LLFAVEKLVGCDKGCEGNNKVGKMRSSHSRSPNPDSLYDTLPSGEIERRWHNNGGTAAKLRTLGWGLVSSRRPVGLHSKECA